MVIARGAFGAFAAGALLGLAIDRASAFTDGIRVGTAMADALELSATFSFADDHLLLRYRVNNNGPVDVYLLNRLYRTTPEWDMSPDVVYIELDRRTQTVWFSKRLADLPAGVNVTAPVAPFVTPLRAGASFTEDVRVPLPVEEYRQYGLREPGIGPGTRERTYQAAWFTIGYYVRPDGTNEETRNVQGTDVVMPRTPPGVRLQFGRLDSKVWQLAIPVLEPGGDDDEELP